MRRLEALEAEFVRVAEIQFAFLRDSYGCDWAVTTDNEGVTVRSANRWLAVYLKFEAEERIFVDLAPMTNGVEPSRFDANGDERLVHFPLADLVQLREPDWRPPSRRHAARDAGSISEVLTEYGAQLRRHGEDILRGSAAPFESLADKMQRDLVALYLREWESFVQRVRTGFTGGIGEYTLGITGRGQLEGFMRQPDADPAIRSRIAQLDREFDNATEPIHGGGSGRGAQFAVVPAPNAARWWRQPRSAIGPLRDYFSTRR